MKQDLHCLVYISISRTCSLVISREGSSWDLLLFFDRGDSEVSHRGHLSAAGLKALGHPLDDMVSLALQFLMEEMILLSGKVSFYRDI